ncbi:aminotransferase class I/II-fold pyridoxal phosphate-dependent enzyme [Saprospiraceae bacterium]|nr:aminotransferase class I/II-fold pyridoxal phosphate-dependent enzyme [Saprospiraceae bacterium]MDA9332505.1 aminotransferase class I/II-fold pyridoxal phosphate-dependent enzyme [Saprospiraceae bacterium]MDB4163453.1 aminotransferase class I/II-fold pyridoxal phosphate-dependent enzyme [Saprospiraceae bacterium]MDB9914779.1 aminotransferase class I/II-fold pyridoxal phosphate-dependent enzyme [Saprospiraceae bacterium]MDC1309073.1 aminotransferase class I/II-fold pyridoxal phosphate-depende
MDKHLKLNSYCVKGGKRNESTKAHQLPLYLSSSFVMEDSQEAVDIFTGQKKGHVYSRYGNPTIDTVANKIAYLEGYDLKGETYGFLTSSGMSAITTLMMSTLQSGDAVLTQGNLYGGSTELLKKILSRMGVDTIFTNLQDLDAVEGIIKENGNIRLLYFETPANPTMACIDIEAINIVASRYDVPTAIDNTFCTPYLQRPLSMGTDYVIHSTTKYLNGHGNSIAGAIITANYEASRKIWETLKLNGSTCNPFDAWLLSNGMKTLAIRMDKHSSNAQSIAEYLSQHDKVTHVNYNGLPDHQDHEIAKKQMSQFGGMLSFTVVGGQAEALATIDRLQYCTHAPTLGDVDTLVLHPATSSHLNVDHSIREKNGITDGMVRVSVGIEDVDDLIADFEQALGQL